MQERITALEEINDEPQTENKALTSKIASLEKQIEQGEQYSRRNCLRISGRKEEAIEDTNALVKYDGPIGSLFISIPLHNSEFRILNSKCRNLHCEFRNSEFRIVKYM